MSVLKHTPAVTRTVEEVVTEERFDFSLNRQQARVIRTLLGKVNGATADRLGTAELFNQLSNIIPMDERFLVMADGAAFSQLVLNEKDWGYSDLL